MYELHDPWYEGLRAVVLAVLLAYLIVRGRHSRFAGLPGARLIVLGFGLLLFATTLDLSDEIPGLERYVVIGATPTEAFIETFFGYLASFIALFIGFIKIIPAIEKSESIKQELRENEEKFRSVFETIPDVIGITRLTDGLVIDLNPAFEELTRIPREQLIGRSSLELKVWVDPTDRDRMVQGVLAQGMIRNLEARFNTGDGQVRDSLISARLLMLQGIPHLLSVYKDITENKVTMRALQESEQKFRSVYETIPDVISITRLRDGLVVDLNPAIEELAGIPRENFIGHSSIEMKTWVNSADRERMVQGVLAQGSIRNMEAQLNTGDGKLRDCLVSARLMQLHGEPHILTVFKDITERKEVMRALRESEARFRLIFESSPDPLVIARADGQGILDVNQAFIVQTGIPLENIRGRTSRELKLWANPAKRDELLERLSHDGAVFNLEAQFCMRNGELRTGLTSAQLVALEGVPCILISIRDITRQKQAEQALMEMDRLKSEFISTAAHELRTPLAVILGYIELLREPAFYGTFSEKQVTEFLDEIYGKGETLSRIIDEMLDISRIESGHQISIDRQPHEPMSLLANIVRRFEIQSTRHELVLEFPGEQPKTLNCDLHRITQVLENLLSNAVKYSPRGGTITVRGGTINGDYVIGVADNGIGMTTEQQARVFDKFYRADSSNTAISGLGLGMSIARQIIEGHGGRIWVESEPEVGTTVTFSLPLAV